MTHSLTARLQHVSHQVDEAAAELQTTRLCMARQSEANTHIAHAAVGLNHSSARIAVALEGMAESGTRLRAAEARLCFQRARLKRSGIALRDSIGQLDKATEVLALRAREARAVAETANRTAGLIAAIEAAAARGESFEHLLAEGSEIARLSALRHRAH